MTALLRLRDPTLPSPFLTESSFLVFWKQRSSVSGRVHPGPYVCNIPDDENGVCDGFITVQTRPILLGYPAQDINDSDGDHVRTALLRLCDSDLTLPFLSESSFLGFWNELLSLVESIQDHR